MALFGNKPDIPAPVVAPPAPEPGVSKADFAALDARLERLAGLMEDGLSRPVVVQAAAAPAPEVPDVTDEDMDAAIAAGPGGASRIKQLIDQKLSRATASVRNELDTFRNYGTTMLSSLAEKVATRDMDPKLLSRFEKEIKNHVAQCEPALRGHPETWQTAYNLVVGAHFGELQRENSEATLRQRAEEEDAGRAALPGKGGRAPARDSDDDSVPSIQELAGADFAASHLGDMTEDEFVKKMNRGKPARARYKDWPDYIARGRENDKRIAAIRDGYDDGGEGELPPSLR